MDTLALSSQKLNVKHLHYTYRTTWKNMWLYQLSRMHLWLVLIPAVPFQAHPWQISAPREIHGNSRSSTINYCPGVGTTQNIHTKIHSELFLLWNAVFSSCTKSSMGSLPTSWFAREWSHSAVSDSATPWSVAHQAPSSMGFSRQEYWSGLPFLSPEDLPDPGIKPTVWATKEIWCARVVKKIYVLYDCLYKV